MTNENTHRKILFPINIKLTVSVLSLMAISLGLYVFLAIDLFKTDKLAYVFESVENQGEQVSLNVTNYLSIARDLHDVMPEASKSSRIIEKIFKGRPELLGYFEFHRGELAKKFIQTQSINEQRAEMLLSNVSDKEFIFDKNSQNESLAYFVHVKNEGDVISFLFVALDKLKSFMPESALFNFYLAINQNYIDNKFESIDLKQDISQNYFHTNLIDNNIVSTIPIIKNEITLFTVASFSKATAAANQLQEKSIYFGGLVAGIIIFAIVFLSGLITKPIKKLYEASMNMAQANFSHRVKLSANDELGVLGDSFNFMAKKIEDFIEQMKEKVRLENELRTAELVQQSFFPHRFIRGRNTELAAYFKSASECGGDWWGHIHFEKSEVIILIDVTGHGTASALLTAMIHNSITALKHISINDPSYSQDASKIMHFLNDSFCSVNTALNATAFVLVIQDNKLNYCNASHNPPYFIKFKEDQSYSKKDFLPLMEKLGRRLGENRFSEYESIDLSFSQKDQILLFTDGIIEASNKEGKAYGQRKFIKSIIANLSNSPIESLSAVTQDFYSYLDGVAADDDITLVHLKLAKRSLYRDSSLTEEQASEVAQRALELNCNIVDSEADACVVVFDQSVREIFARDRSLTSIKSFVSFKSFMEKENPFYPEDYSPEQSSVRIFSQEDVSRVSQEVTSCVDEVISDDSFSETSRYLATIAIELIQNAIIFGKSTDQAEKISFSIESSSQNYIVTVKDCYGGLDYSTLLGKIQRSYQENTYEMKESGAGLGLGMVMDLVDEFVLTRKEGEFTEIRCIINKYKRLKEFKDKKRSTLLFMEV